MRHFFWYCRLICTLSPQKVIDSLFSTNVFKYVHVYTEKQKIQNFELDIVKWMVRLIQQLSVEDAVYQQVSLVRNFVFGGHEQRRNNEHTTLDAPRSNRTDFLCLASR